MSNQQSDVLGVSSNAAIEGGKDWKIFLLLAFIGLPILMTTVIAGYGFIVWFMQIFFFGPPS